MPSTRPTRRAALAGLGAVVAGLAGCPSRPTGDPDPAIDAPDVAPVGDDLGLRIHGLDPASTVTLRAATLVGQDRFGSYATFEADADGAVDLAEDAPTAGTYDGVAPMGPVWSMRPREGLPAAERLAKPEGASDGETVFRASVDGEHVASTRVRRRVAPPSVEQVDSPDGLVGRAYLPDTEEPSPGVLVLHGGGPGRAMDRPARQLAACGFAAFALRYVGPGAAIPSRPRTIPLSYFGRGIEWLTGLDGVVDGAVGTVGWSLGGQLALLLGARRDDVGAVVSYNGSSFVTHFATFGASPWAVDGEPLPYLPVDVAEHGEHRPVGGDGVRAFHTRPAYEAAFSEADEVTLEPTRIPVERVDGPVLYVAGADDAVLPADEAGRRVVDRLDDADHPHRYDALVYEDAGHRIGFPYRPTTGRAVARQPKGNRAFGGTPAGYARAEADSWETVQSYLRAGLGGGQSA
ncbi:acyl-CoA thioesterase/bile acid-CoA:amino acid N-acyltransferase family protein [Halobium salinum]|uniref:Acyl-CoA thioesterase/bile acid-CoA:amino acid N-acyltransferase family protein n=1 Tax=Halobium salinum TaxID=1364940 RepID=A0ABD5P8V7_9EURY|nr:acyl-CoA thioester hydrolase/BAAT C-terminal domain-containing protein [Halobium salinum]